MEKNILGNISDVVENNSDELFKELEELIEIESVEEEPYKNMPFGKPVDRALNKVLSLGTKMGFNVSNHEGYIGIIEYGEDSEIIGVLTHIDVVPPGEISEWETPPFVMTEKNGRLYGRGVVDDKGPLISSLYGLYALKQIGTKFNKKVRIIIGTNEETGWGGIKYYKNNFEIPDTSICPDGMFTVVNREKGIIRLRLKKNIDNENLIIKGGEASNLVPAGATATINNSSVINVTRLENLIEKMNNNSVAEFKLKKDINKLQLRCKGKSAHAMTPEKGENAIFALLKLLKLSNVPSENIKNELNTIWGMIGDCTDGSSLGIDCYDEESGALTINLGKINLDNNNLSLTFDIRTPVTFSIKNIINKFEKKFKKNDYVVDDKNIKEPLYVDSDTKLIEILSNVYEKITGEKSVIHSIGGGTYARAFPNCVCFGSVYPDEEVTAHCVNENTLKSNIIQNAKMYGFALYQLISKNTKGEE